MRRLAAIAAALVAVPSLAMAMQCGERADLVDALADGYGETFSGAGLQGDRRLIEVWTSTDGGTWTILMTRPDGITCIMASGTDWRDPLPGDKATGVRS